MTTITLELPQNIYDSVQEAAARAGQSPQELITQLLGQNLGQNIQGFADDPLEEFIGAFRSDIPDWGENHDRYLGQELLENHNV